MRQSIVNDRLESYKALRRELGRKPTTEELGKAWGLRNPHSVTGYVNSARVRYGVTFEIKFVSRGKAEPIALDALAEFCDKVFFDYEIRPTQSEAALYFGVTRQRIEQLARRADKRGIDLRFRPGGPIDWRTMI